MLIPGLNQWANQGGTSVSPLGSTFWASQSSDFILPSIMGFIAGGVVVNSLKEELPEKGEGRVFPFVLGAFGYAALLLMVAASEG